MKPILTKEQYLEKQGMCCPYCGQEDKIKVGSVAFCNDDRPEGTGHGAVVFPNMCEVCKAQWIDLFRLYDVDLCTE